MFVYPGVIVLSNVLFRSEGSSSCCFSYVGVFALFVGTFVAIDEIVQVFSINLVFDVEFRRKFFSCLDDPACDVGGEVSG